ncbi:flagellar biosynthesis protein FlhF [Anaerocolumna jejuensis DSM 15929]|uniref:Flagellar biosynthesis protein FlhF n=1 Tax=Anaerocolumna jejuensis DSM 15929 TaxID=1121322 RepID=A0A1M6NE34_9FIRM|nr:flagellar biosynthesis protein FlhF [Anaerocolumna jejuensis]SHJ94012.1 flagellar biosynthesis protein FlhF [Anaerocolumna jejuensis DSM 15929]
MIIKKYQANTETEAILLAKNELGKDAIVMNIKTISPKGVYRLFRKPTVEITAAVDDTGALAGGKKEAEEGKSKPSFFTNTLSAAYDGEDRASAFVRPKEINQSNEDASAIEKKLNSLQELLEKQLQERQEAKKAEEAPKQKDPEEQKREACMKLVYDQLLRNEVDEKYVEQLISEIEGKVTRDITIDNILSHVYQKIILKLGQPKIINIIENKCKFIFFIGPTGVGKTTTIAKIASDLKLNKKLKVAMLTSDTYRIAAVEQLRTYANILGIPMKVIYTEEEMLQAKEELSDYDVVLVDTAGRSHKNREQRDDVERLLGTIEEEQKEIYLVLSATTKYKDLIRITENYSEITNYRIIFTKLDETISVGNILNIKMYTNAELSYATYGQNVPDDIGKLDTQETAKKLLGGFD